MPHLPRLPTSNQWCSRANRYTLGNRDVTGGEQDGGQEVLQGVREIPLSHGLE